MAEEKEDVNFSKEKTDIENGNGELAMPVNRLFPIYHEPIGKSLFPAVEPDLQTGYPVFYVQKGNYKLWDWACQPCVTVCQ